MTTDDDLGFDGRIADWLQEDPYRAPAQVLDTVRAALPSVPQRRSSIWLPPGVPRAAPYAAGVGALVILAGLALGLLGPSAAGPRPSPSPGGSPELPNVVHSGSHLYTIRLPSEWHQVPGSGLEAADVYTGREGELQVALRVIPPGTGQDAWAATYFATQMRALGGSCSSATISDAEEIRLGNDYGLLAKLRCLSSWLVLVPVGDRGYDIRFTPAATYGSSAEGIGRARGFLLAMMHALTFDGGPLRTSPSFGVGP
jgi:hypothetical protein